MHIAGLVCVLRFRIGEIAKRMASDAARVWKDLGQVRTVDSAGNSNAAAVEIFEFMQCSVSRARLGEVRDGIFGILR
jgi:uncharacterized protein YbaA (DUF1428 family)